jgi:hypothetical protein
MNTLTAGDRVRLFGGYDMQPTWLGDADHYMGTVESFIPGQNESPAAIVRLDRPITVEGVSGEVVVLELRYVGSEWSEGGTVHVELCDFVPEPKSWPQRRQGKWVESNASYEKA